MNGSGSSSEKKHQREDEVIVNIKDNLEPQRPCCCIYKVPKKLRNINNDAYTPHVVSIGPYHHGQKEWDAMLSKKEWKWDDMQKQKKRYKGKFDEKRLEKIENFVKKEEQRIRHCYEANLEHFESDKFIEMIVDDAVFIIELLMNYHDRIRDFFLSKPWLTNAIKLDLQLLENQLPYFVLNESYELAYRSCNTRKGLPPFITLSCRFFGYREPYGDWSNKEVKHFVDLIRHTMLVDVKIDRKLTESPGGKIEDLPSAVKLNESGVKFMPVNKKDAVKPEESGDKGKEKSLLNIEFGKREDSYIPWLRGDVLKIPRLKIEDGTECSFRNLMALEQCHYPFETYICNYIDLMDALINTRKDVDFLFEKGIISNCVGDHDSIKEMINKLCLEITPSASCYQDMCQRLKNHHGKWWNRTKAILISVYFENLWRGTGTVAATILLLLTLLQTIQRFYPALFVSKK